MKKAKRFISAVMAAVMAFTVNASVMAETVSEPEMIDINGYPCYERDGQYWTILDGEEYLVINLDEIMGEPMEAGSEDDAGINPCSGIVDECPIGTPPLLTHWIYNGCVELSQANNYTYKDRCYLTYGDYYSPIYYFEPRNQSHSFTAKIYAEDISIIDTYYFDIFKHTNSLGWYDDSRKSLSLGLRERTLFTGTTTQEVNGLAFKFLSNGVHVKELYYTVILI